jgi:hypothetical protein
MLKRRHNRVDRRFQAEVNRLHPPPVRWKQVERRLRRRRLWTFWSLVLLAIGLTILLAGGLLAGRTALDPTFSPPIFSRPTVSGSLGEPVGGRELVPASRMASLPGAEEAERQGELGYVATAKVRFTDLGETAVLPQWVLRRAGSKGRRPVLSWTLGDPVVPDANSDVRTLRAWVPLPPRSGRHVMELQLTQGVGETVGRLRSRPFNAVGRVCCRQYETPTYVAAIPLGWDLRSDYILASEDRYVTRLAGPGDMEIAIDTTLDEQGDPRDSQRELESILSQGSESYKRHDVRVFEVHGAPLVEWSYRSGQDLYVNDLFYRGENGYAVLGSSSRSHFRELRDISRRIARLLRDRGR